MKVDGVCGEQLIYFFSLTESDRVQHMRIWVINNRSETRSLNSVVQRLTSLIHTWKTVPNFKTHKTKFYFYLLLKLLILIGHIRKTFLSKNPKLALIQRIPLSTQKMTSFYSSDILAIIIGMIWDIRSCMENA